MQFTLALSSLLVASAAAFAPVSQTAGSRQATHLADDLFSQGPGGNKNEMSKALPFAPRPKILDGSMAGDVGFE